MRKSELELNQVLESITDAFISIDDNWECAYINPKAAKLLNRGAEDMVGRNIWDCVPELIDTPCASEFRECRRAFKPRFFEFFFAPNDAWYESHCYPSKNLLSVLFVDITQWKREEIMAESTDARAAEAVSEALGGFWDMELSATGSDVLPDRSNFSPNLKRVLGYKDDELPNSLTAWFGLIHSEDVPRLKKALQDHLTGKSNFFDCEYRILARNGEYRWFYSRGNVLRSPVSRVVRWIALTLDVTKKKRDEEYRARLAAIVESSQDGIIGQTLHGRITSWNPGAERLFGFQANEVVGKRIHDAIIPADRHAEMQAALNRIANGEIIEPFETVRVDKRGRPLDIMLTLSPIKNESGKIIGVSAIDSDITQTKQMLARTRRLNQTLMAVLRAFPDIVWVVSRENDVQFMNPAAEEFFKTRNASKPLPAKVQDQMMQALRNGKDYLPTDFRGVHRIQVDGEHRYYLCRLVTMKDDKSDLFGLTVMLQDVTDFRMLDEIKTNLIGTVSHELKTPATSIRMSLLLLLEEQIGQLNENQRELLTVARDEIDRLLRTLNTLLDLTRFEEGRYTIKPERIKIPELVDAAIADVGKADYAGDVRVVPVLEQSLPIIEADNNRIVHVLSNLLSNAVKHSPKNSVVRLQVRMHDPTHVYFGVVDQGPGVPREYQLRIFDKFFKAPGNDKPGSGLGLSIVREFVRAHGGSVGVNSDPPNGSEFYVILPVKSL